MHLNSQSGWLFHEFPGLSLGSFGTADEQAKNFAIVVASCGLCVTGILSVPLITCLISTLPAALCDKPQRWLYSAVLMMSPLVVALLIFGTVFAPEHFHILFVVKAFWEALAIYSILMLMLGYLGEVGETQLAAFEGQEEKKMIWLPLPIVCCCFFSCFTMHRPSAWDLQAIRILVLQYVIYNPMYAFISASSLHPKAPFLALRMFSTVLAIYAILVLIQACSKTLQSRKPHMKFWTMKFLLVATLMTHKIVMLTAKVAPIETSGAASVIATVPFALLTYFAYSKEDLVNDDAAKEEQPFARDSHLPTVEA